MATIIFMENIWSYSLTVFMAFFAIMNPIVNIPIFGKRNFVIIGKIMGIILGVLGANMLVQGIKLAFNI